MNNAVLLRAYNNGSQACFDGVDSGLCPFPCESEEGREWKRGHADRFFRELKKSERRWASTSAHLVRSDRGK